MADIDADASKRIEKLGAFQRKALEHALSCILSFSFYEWLLGYHNFVEKKKNKEYGSC